MIEKILLRIVKTFIYIFSMRMAFINDLAFHYTLNIFLYYLVISVVLSLCVESLEYILSDYIKYTPYIITVILSLTIYVYMNYFTKFYFIVLLYLDVVLINYLINTYQMYKNLKLFKMKRNVIE